MSDVARKPHLWCLYSFNDSNLIEGLLFDEARAVISSVKSSDLEKWIVWREDWPDWRPVNEVEGLTEMIFRNMMASPPPLPGTATMSEKKFYQGPQGLTEHSGENTQADSGEIKLTNSLIQIDPQSDSSSGQFIVRKNRRFKKRYEITIVVGEQSFETHSLDISVGGILLEDTLPGWVRGNFKVRIKKPNIKQKIELMAYLLDEENKGDLNRIGILPLQSESDEKNLETWLAA